MTAARTDPALPVTLQRRAREVPALAWTVAQAYAAFPRWVRSSSSAWLPVRLVAACWPVPMWLLVWLPVVAANAASGTVVRRDRHAVLSVRPAARPALAPLGAAVLVAVGVLSGSLLVVPAALLPWWATTVLLLPSVVDGAGVARRAVRAGTGSADRARARTVAGQAVWRIELYAAHPAGDSHGSRLASQLLEHVPAGVWLVTAAADAKLSEHYRSRYGFRAWDPARPLLLERPPTGSAAAGAGVVPPIPEQQQSSQ